MEVGAAPERTDQFVHVGRQPVYDRNCRIVGYELLFRANERATRATQNGTEATSQVIVSAFTDFGLEQLVGSGLGFVNMTRDFLVGTLPVPFAPELAVLEVLETIDVDDEVLAGVHALVARGYRIALDDFEFGTRHDQLLPIANYVKLQVAGIDRAEVVAAVQACRTYPNLQLLAERLETDEDLSFARDLGFDLFQGYLLGRPQVLSAAALSPTRMRRLELLGHLGRPDVDVALINSIVLLDPGLSYRMLRAVSSAAVGLRRPVSSVQEAMVMLGTTVLFQWLSLMAISDLGGGSEEHLVPVLSRSRMCQLVAERLHLDPASAFTLGMLTGVAELLGTPLTELGARLPLTEEVAKALVGGGPLGTVLAMVQAYEHGDTLDTRPGVRAADTAGAKTGDKTGPGGGIPGAELALAYLAGLDWATHTYQTVLGGTDAADPGPGPKAGPEAGPRAGPRAGAKTGAWTGARAGGAARPGIGRGYSAM